MQVFTQISVSKHAVSSPVEPHPTTPTYQSIGALIFRWLQMTPYLDEQTLARTVLM